MCFCICVCAGYSQWLSDTIVIVLVAVHIKKKEYVIHEQCSGRFFGLEDNAKYSFDSVEYEQMVCHKITKRKSLIIYKFLWHEHDSTFMLISRFSYFFVWWFVYFHFSIVVCPYVPSFINTTHRIHCVINAFCLSQSQFVLTLDVFFSHLFLKTFAATTVLSYILCIFIAVFFYLYTFFYHIFSFFSAWLWIEWEMKKKKCFAMNKNHCRS